MYGRDAALLSNRYLSNMIKLEECIYSNNKNKIYIPLSEARYRTLIAERFPDLDAGILMNIYRIDNVAVEDQSHLDILIYMLFYYD
jgi:hypothetical protein